jgi:HIV Tat-specific factor 1
MATAPQHPLVSEFASDPRIFVDQQSGKHHYEDDNGQEWEWAGQAWIPLVRIQRSFCLPTATERGIRCYLCASRRSLTHMQIDEDQWKAQQSAYAIAGVDENVSWPGL